MQRLILESGLDGNLFNNCALEDIVRQHIYFQKEGGSIRHRDEAQPGPHFLTLAGLFGLYVRKEGKLLCLT